MYIFQSAIHLKAQSDNWCMLLLWDRKHPCQNKYRLFISNAAEGREYSFGLPCKKHKVDDAGNCAPCKSTYTDIMYTYRKQSASSCALCIFGYYFTLKNILNKNEFSNFLLLTTRKKNNLQTLIFLCAGVAQVKNLNFALNYSPDELWLEKYHRCCPTQPLNLYLMSATAEIPAKLEGSQGLRPTN